MKTKSKENITDNVRKLTGKSSINKPSGPSIASGANPVKSPGKQGMDKQAMTHTLPISKDSKKASKSRSKESREGTRNDVQKIKKLHPRKLF